MHAQIDLRQRQRATPVAIHSAEQLRSRLLVGHSQLLLRGAKALAQRVQRGAQVGHVPLVPDAERGNVILRHGLEAGDLGPVRELKVHVVLAKAIALQPGLHLRVGTPRRAARHLSHRHGWAWAQAVARVFLRISWEAIPPGHMRMCARQGFS